MSSILTSFRDTATRSNGFKVIKTRVRPISARVASMGDLLCLFTGAPPSGRGLTGNDTENDMDLISVLFPVNPRPDGGAPVNRHSKSPIET